jgi:hypothetical protein
MDAEERQTKVCADCVNTPKRGERWDSISSDQTCRVMSDPVEGYVMARYKGAMPWLLHVNDWHKKFRRQGGK